MNPPTLDEAAQHLADYIPRTPTPDLQEAVNTDTVEEVLDAYEEELNAEYRRELEDLGLGATNVAVLANDVSYARRCELSEEAFRLDPDGDGEE